MMLGVGGRGATVAAAVFAVHPICTEPVNYISSRSELLAGAGFLGGLYGYLQWRDAGARSGAVAYLVLSLLAYGAGMLGKSVAIGLPGVLLMYELGPGRRSEVSPRPLGRLLPYHAPYWLLGAAYVVMVQGMVSSALSEPVRGFDVQVWTQLKAVVYYLMLLVMPVTLNVEHQFFASTRLLNPATFTGVLVIASAALVAGCRIQRGNWVWFAWLGLSLAPTFLIPLNVLVNEHRLYIAMAALVIWPGSRWLEWLQKPRSGTLLVLFVAFLSVLSFQRNSMWHSELSLWTDSVSKAPLMPRAHVHLGNALQREGQVGEAAEAYEAALKLDPQHRAAATNLGTLYYDAAIELTDSAFAQRYYRMAADYYERALSVDDTYPEALNNLGSVYLMLERNREAIDTFRKVIARNPNFADAYYNLGQALHREGNLEESTAAYGKALQRDPDDEILAESARVFVELRRWEKAAASYREALRHRDRLEYRHNLGEVLLAQGKSGHEQRGSPSRSAGVDRVAGAVCFHQLFSTRGQSGQTARTTAPAPAGPDRAQMTAGAHGPAALVRMLVYRVVSSSRTGAGTMLVIVIAVYANSLDNAFQYDDLHSIVENHHLRQLSNIPDFFANPELFSRDPDKAMYRPLVLTTLALNHAASGLEVVSYHVVNIILHFGCAVLVWCLLLRLERSSCLALLGGLLVAVHPICTEPVNYISSRSELQAALGVLGAFLTYVVAAQRASFPWGVVSLVLFAGGLLSKSVAIALPALLVAYELYRGSLLTATRRLVPYAAVSVGYLAIVSSFVQKAVLEQPVRPLVVQTATQVKAVVYYAKLLLMPTALNVHHSFWEGAPGDWSVWFSVLLLLSGCGALVAAGARGSTLFLGLSWIAITLAPSSIVRSTSSSTNTVSTCRWWGSSSFSRACNGSSESLASSGLGYA